MEHDDDFERRYSPEQIKIFVKLFGLREVKISSWMKLLVGYSIDEEFDCDLTEIHVREKFINLKFGETALIEFLFGNFYSVHIVHHSIAPYKFTHGEMLNQVLDKIKQFVPMEETL